MNVKRLLKLVKHLESNNLGLDKFYIYTYCGRGQYGITCGCAIGELAFIYPRSWKNDLQGNVSIHTAFPKKATYKAVADFFNITIDEQQFLFFNKYKNTTTAKDVANRIREFIKSKTP